MLRSSACGSHLAPAARCSPFPLGKGWPKAGVRSPQRNQEQSSIMMDLVFSSTAQLAAAIQARHMSAVEVLDAHLAQIERHNPALNAVVTLDAERARTRARDADAALARGEV